MTDNPNHGHARRSPQGGLNWSQQLRGRLLAVKVAEFTNMGGGGARVARAHGYSGIILNGPARDSHELRDLGFPLFSTGICPDSIVIDEVREGSSIHYELNQPVVIAGQLIRPGDVIIGDHDVEPALVEGETVLQRENDFLPQIESGRAFKDLIQDPNWSEPSPLRRSR